MSDLRAFANGRGVHAAQPAEKTGGWISPNAKKKGGRLIYWGDFTNGTITIYSARGVNGAEIGQITQGLSEPERLFVDRHGNVYATNLGNNTITAYKPGQITPFLTISNGVNSPTGLTVDAAGTVYCANTGNDTITVYPKGQTSPSLTIPVSNSPEYLATDAQDNLYASIGYEVYEFAPGSSNGTNLGLPQGASALEADRQGNLIVLYDDNTIRYFAPGQTQPSKEVTVTAGTPFALSLSASGKEVLVSVDRGYQFIIQRYVYPKGATLTAKLSTGGGDWSLAISPDSVLGN